MEKRIGYKDIFSQKEFMKTVIADIINRFGDSVDSIAFTWMVYEVTQNPAWSALIFGVNRLPTIFLQPFAGAAIEGKNKKQIMVAMDIIRGICVGFVAFALMLGFINQWIILLATLSISCAEAFRNPASTALLPQILDKKYYEFGLSLSKSTSSIAELIGIGFGGIMIATFSVHTAIFIDMGTFLVSALILITLKVKEKDLKMEKTNFHGYIDNLKGGFLYLKKHPLLQYFLILALFLNAILVPYNALQAPVISQVLGTGEIMLSVISISITIGMLVGAVCYPYISQKIKGRSITMIGGYSIALIYLGIVLVGRFIASHTIKYVIISLIIFVAGFAISLFSSYVSVEFVKNVEERFLARTSALFGAVCVAAMPLVSFFISLIAGFVSTEFIFLAAGILDIVICIYLCNKKRFEAINKKDSEEDIVEETVGNVTTF